MAKDEKVAYAALGGLGIVGLAYALSRKPPAPQLSPADINLSNLIITPEEVLVGKAVTISVVATNIGEERGSYTVVLSGDFEAERIITLDPDESTPVSFQAIPDEPGTYYVSVDDLSGSFVATEGEPPIPPPWPEFSELIEGLIAGTYPNSDPVPANLLLPEKSAELLEAMASTNGATGESGAIITAAIIRAETAALWFPTDIPDVQNEITHLYNTTIRGFISMAQYQIAKDYLDELIGRMTLLEQELHTRGYCPHMASYGGRWHWWIEPC